MLLPVRPSVVIPEEKKGELTGLLCFFWSGREVLDPAAQTLGVVPNVVSFSLDVHVTALNDPPDIFYSPGRLTSTRVLSADFSDISPVT